MERSELIYYITKKISEEKSSIQNKCMIVGIEGQGCSGKSVLSQEIKSYLISIGFKSEIVSIDDFCNKREIRYGGDLAPYKQHYYNNFNYNKFECDILEQVNKNGTIEFSDHVLDVRKNTYTKKLDISLGKEGILIVEGIFIFKNKFKKYFDYSIMLIIDRNEQLERAKQRDLMKNGNIEQLLKKYNDRYFPAYEFYDKLNQPCEFVDLIIDNTNVDMPNVVKEKKDNNK